MGAIRGKATDRSTLYYDPLVAYHHMTKAGGHLLLSHELIGQKPDEARLLFEGPRSSWAGAVSSRCRRR